MKLKTVLFVIVLNLIIVAAEIFFGLLSGSMALIADAAHNLGDVAAVVVTFIALVYGAKAATARMTFGWIRAEMMAAFVNSLFLCATMIYVLYESGARFINPEAVDAVYVMWVAAVALAANGFSAWLLKGAGVGHHHHDHSHAHEHHNHHEDLNIRSAYLHMLSDALISLGVIVGGAAVYFFEISRIDSAIAVLFSLWILKEAFAVLKRSFFSLMDINADELETYETALLQYDEISSVHDLHLFRPSSKECHFSAHLVLSGNPDLAAVEHLLERVHHTLEHLGVTHSLLQPETAKYAQESPLCAAHR